jgi:hypothetical protein
MKTLLWIASLALAVALLAALVLSHPAEARDDRLHLPLRDALSAPAAQAKLDRNIPLYFGNQTHPAVERIIGDWTSNRKTNAFNKPPKTACEWVFLSVALSLQARARQEGGDAVIDIKSEYKGVETVSDSDYVCGSGNVVAGVALKGTVVKLAR